MAISFRALFCPATASSAGRDEPHRPGLREERCKHYVLLQLLLHLVRLGPAMPHDLPAKSGFTRMAWQLRCEVWSTSCGDLDARTALDMERDVRDVDDAQWLRADGAGFIRRACQQQGEAPESATRRSAPDKTGKLRDGSGRGPQPVLGNELGSVTGTDTFPIQAQDRR
jgi:hypothetical protein